MQYANPNNAAKQARAHRDYWMGYARAARTRNARRECVSIARVMNHDLVRALKQAH